MVFRVAIGTSQTVLIDPLSVTRVSGTVSLARGQTVNVGTLPAVAVESLPPVPVSSLPPVAVSSLPAVEVSSLPLVAVSSLPAVEVSSLPLSRPVEPSGWVDARVTALGALPGARAARAALVDVLTTEGIDTDPLAVAALTELDAQIAYLARVAVGLAT